MTLLVRQILFLAFLVVVFLAPLPLGSHRPWSSSLLATLVGLILILEGITAAFSDRQYRTCLRRAAVPLSLLAATLAWIHVQTLENLPGEFAHPLWVDAGLAMGRTLIATISLDPWSTQTAAVNVTAYGGVGWLAYRFCQDKDRAILALKAFVFVTTVYAAYAIAAFLSGSQTILWLQKWAFLRDATGTFVARSSQAAYMGFAILASVTVAATALDDALHHHRWHRAIGAVLKTVWLPLLGVAFSATALILTNSRGGIACTILSLMVLLAALVAARVIRRRTAMFVAGPLMLIVIWAALSGGERLAERIIDETGFSDQTRLYIYERVMAAIGTAPILGFGFGTFDLSFRAFRTEGAPLADWDMAHSTYLENMMELGIPAALALFAAIAWMGGACARALVIRRRRREFGALGLSATVLVATQSLIDFTLQIEGIAVTYAMLIGLCYAQAWPSHRRSNSPNANPIPNH